MCGLFGRSGAVVVAGGAPGGGTAIRQGVWAAALWVGLTAGVGAQAPLHVQRLAGPLPGCRPTHFLGEAILSREHRPFLVFLNTLGRVQRTEVTFYEEGGQSPAFVLDIPSGRSTHDFLQNRLPWMEDKWKSFSATVRWEVGGHVHWVTWRTPAFMSDPVAWLFGWRTELVSPSTQHVVCEVP